MTTRKQLETALRYFEKAVGASEGTYHLSSYKPGERRLYAVEEEIGNAGGCRRPFGSGSMYAGELYTALHWATRAVEEHKRRNGQED
jgi:hypothetical protein